MEVVKKSIQVNRISESITHQFHMGEDMNVSDAKEDVIRILQNYGKIHIQETQKMEQYLKVKGYLEFQILYATDDMDKVISCLEGKIPMEEMVYIDESEEEYYVSGNQVELQSSLINSRKISLKALVELQIHKSSVREEEITTDIETDETDMSVLKKYKTVPVLELKESKNDTYRIKEEVKLPGTKENIGNILVSRMGNMQLDTRAGVDEIILHGEFQFFCMYISDEWKQDYVSQTVSFDGKIECMNMDESMFHHLRYEVGELSVDTQMDEDGEIRIMNLEATIKLNIQVYEEKDYKVLEDLYMLEQKCSLPTKPIYCESLLLQNQSKCKIVETLLLPELREDLLQICSSNGMIQIEHIEEQKGSIDVDGILHIDVLYLRENDTYPYASWQGMIPFSHHIEGPEAEEMMYDLEHYLEQISVGMAGNGEMEIKAVVNFHGFMREPQLLDMIYDVEVEAFSSKELEEQAGIIGYIYKEGENLWDLAKKYHTTIEGILKNNKIDEKDIKAGQKLLIFRENVSIL